MRYGFNPRPGHSEFSHVGTMPLVTGFSRGSPVSPALSFRCCSILTSITLTGSENLDVKSRRNVFTQLHLLHHLEKFLDVRLVTFTSSEIVNMSTYTQLHLCVMKLASECTDHANKALVALLIFSAFEAGKRGTYKGETATRIKCAIAAKHTALNGLPSDRRASGLTSSEEEKATTASVHVLKHVTGRLDYRTKCAWQGKAYRLTYNLTYLEAHGLPGIRTQSLPHPRWWRTNRLRHGKSASLKINMETKRNFFETSNVCVPLTQNHKARTSANSAKERQSRLRRETEAPFYQGASGALRTRPRFTSKYKIKHFFSREPRVSKLFERQFPLLWRLRFPAPRVLQTRRTSVTSATPALPRARLAHHASKAGAGLPDWAICHPLGNLKATFATKNYENATITICAIFATPTKTIWQPWQAHVSNGGPLGSEHLHVQATPLSLQGIDVFFVYVCGRSCDGRRCDNPRGWPRRPPSVQRCGDYEGTDD
ncbi:hypothetical protein PR048_024415 [Dryococelus australis]|uniref:Uncharacterized protein n=1 Tax=Dryococelus australis TaxID=614101 RepID=A0ABQ9GNJ2_9NEOP|nr:hypothetical protein PR048_024415 [Dryococelus australis]